MFAYAPFGLWPTALLTISLLLVQLNLQSAKASSQIAFCFGLGWFGSGISWVHVSIDQFGGLPLPISVLLMLLLAGYLALFPALMALLNAKLSPSKTFNIALAPPLWLLVEFLRSILLTGFPWLSLGYSQIDSPIAALAPIIGEIGISFYLLVFATLVAAIIVGKQRMLGSSLLAALIGVPLVASQFSSLAVTEKHVNVALIQGNIKQELKWAPEQEWPSMLKYLDLTRQHYDAELIIWPESAVPSIEPLAQDFLDMANRSAALNNSSIITGIINYNFESKDYFNSLIVLGKQDSSDNDGDYYYNNPNRYYKHHLLPIGEFVPFQELLRPLAPLFNLPMSSFSRGDFQQTNLVANGLNILPLICFEIAFANQLAANLNADTDLILTVSNDAWFGDSHGPHQHLEIARMRALEFGRPVLRSTNNGITAVIDHQGAIIGEIPQFEEAVLSSTVTLVKGDTLYSRYGHLTNVLLPLIFFAIIWLQLHLRQRKVAKNSAQKSAN